MILIFDLDGTLVDSAPDIRAAVNLMLAGEGLGPLDLPTVTGFVGNGMPKLVERVMAAKGIDPARHKALTQVTLDHYNAAPSALTRPYAHVPQALAALEAAGHRLAVCTNKPEAPALECVKALGGGAAVFIGDSEVDAETAAAAGLPFYLFTEGYRKSPVSALPHRAGFSDFAALPGLIG